MVRISMPLLVMTKEDVESDTLTKVENNGRRETDREVKRGGNYFSSEKEE